MTNFINKQIDGKSAINIVVGVFLIAFLVIILNYGSLIKELFTSFPQISLFTSVPEIKDIKKFSSEEEFKSYLREGGDLRYYGWGIGGAGEEMLAPTALRGVDKSTRFSETNVQVGGIDEPDIVKTDGKEIYFSPNYFFRYWEAPSLEEGIIRPIPETNKTNIIKAFPASELSIENKIDNSGDLLLTKNILVILSQNEINGYNVSNPKFPEKKWEIKLEDGSYIAGARLYKSKIYLITKTGINEDHPCPIKPLKIDGNSLNIECRDIYYPINPVPVDATFTTMILDPNSGRVEKNISFVSSSSSPEAVIYMSEKAIYLTYTYNESTFKFLHNFLKEKALDIISPWLIEKMDKLDSYEISEQSKMTEFQLIWEKYLYSLDEGERTRITNEFSNRMADYYKEHIRELEKTGIIKIGLDKFLIEAGGVIPGQPLNQFSLDEYKENLRVATTIGERWWGFYGFGSGESANDVYVLDKNLNIEGEVKNLGLEERIYSVRFIEDKGYVVTFRQIDPFYVLDLSDPKKPGLKGELKIPGYSSYLHPITKDKILGIGQEDWKIKISLFDVSSPDKPQELDKYTLDESWSDILSTHHAFLMDDKHEIFFLPGGKGGYVFSYKDNKLELKKVVSQVSARRAIYIDDYLYIIGDDKISVLDETNWGKVNELEF